MKTCKTLTVLYKGTFNQALGESIAKDLQVQEKEDRHIARKSAGTQNSRIQPSGTKNRPEAAKVLRKT